MTKNLFFFNLLIKTVRYYDTAHACMESTGGYEVRLAQYLYDNTIKYAELNLPIPEASLRGIDGKFSFGPFCFDYNNRGKPRGIYPKKI